MDAEAADDPGARSQAHDRPRDRNGSPQPVARAPGVAATEEILAAYGC